MGPGAKTSTPLPITQNRLKEIFDERKLRYFIDSEGDLGTLWEDSQFHFLLRGEHREILLVAGCWSPQLSMEDLSRVRAFIAAWHREMLFPTCTHRITDKGKIRVFTEHAIDYEQGVTREQLALHIDCALGSSSQFFDALADEFQRS